MSGELSPASVYVSLLPVVEACVVVAVPGRVGEVRVAADEPEAVDLDPGVLACRLDAPATVKAVLEQGGRVLLRGRAVRDPGPSGGRVRGVAKQRPSFLRNFAEGTEDEASDRADRREPQLGRSFRRASEDWNVFLYRVLCDSYVSSGWDVK